MKIQQISANRHIHRHTKIASEIDHKVWSVFFELSQKKRDHETSDAIERQ